MREARMSKAREQFEAALSAVQQAAFARYYALLVEWNERMNLTAVTEESEVYIKHFWDSLLALRVPEFTETLGEAGKLADVGTGAGFPGLPLAICCPQVHVVLMDSLQKRTRFLEAVVEELGLKNVTVVHGRAEDLARDDTWRQRFDVVVSRAVARLNVLLELTVPFVRPGGCVLAYKGPQLDEELPDGRRAAGQLSAKIERVERTSLPMGEGERTLAVIRVEGTVSPTFPRKAGTPQRRPL
ncbi:16S rRNA (guanine(527)-N(7))-methyltransferase RsmG [Alicyclobacillus herbarius]|uniref:16S rRNA (guanine(527)-N(7))-methyltransferase RsmG n=1 Tax=Alicyclobacillus herbarius TaxID=122960 RepID=UPI00040A04EF|nr:16S rRNA (guanine(527)-N(7))-methyltransferase RsmG [Alicyclobacillus herbarius]